MTNTLQPLSLVEKVEPGPSSLLHATLEGPTEYTSECTMGVEVYMDSCMAFNGSCLHGHLDYFQQPLLGGRPTTKLGDHGTSNKRS